ARLRAGARHAEGRRRAGVRVSEQRFGDFDENQTHVPDSFLDLYRDARSRLTAPRETVAARYELCEDLANLLTERCSTVHFRDGVRARRAAGGAEPLVRFVGVQKTYDGVQLVVRQLDLDIRRGEFLTLLGPSGSGKTTTLMMLAGFESPTAGEILLDGKPITR